VALPSFKQYREKDGQFYFKLVDAQGLLILQSKGFTSPKEVGQTIARLQTDGIASLPDLNHVLVPLTPDQEPLLAQALKYLLNSTKNS